MSLWRLLLRSLWHYRRTNLTVLVGLAVATAVITGSLLVGDSVKGSLRDTALARLGNITSAVTADHFFRDALAGKVGRQAAPVLMAAGTVCQADTEAAAPNVTVLGVDARFWPLYPGKTRPELPGRSAAVNEALARDLGLKVGDAVLLTVGKTGAVPADSLFAHRTRQNVIRTLRLQVAAILPDRGPGGFTLSTATAAPRNLFIDRERLQEALGITGKANILLCSGAVSGWGNRLQPADLGLHLTPGPGILRVQTDGVVLPEAMVHAVHRAALETGAVVSRSSIYLATTIDAALPDVKYVAPPPALAYALVAGVEVARGFTFRSGGGPAPSRDGLWLNSWAADDLHARMGQRVMLDYLVPQRDGSYRTERKPFRVEGIVEMTGAAADRNQMPPLAGITDSERIDDWDAPFPIDMRRVTERDDQYWTRYRTTPKAFVNLQAARAMWQRDDAGADWVTTLLVRPPQGMTPDAFAPQFAAALCESLTPEQAGFRTMPLRARALASARGTTDFSELFLSMSFFLVLAAAGLAGMLARLTVERRATEAGIMAASGFPAEGIRRVLWGEGLLLVLGGVLFGVPLGLLYATAIIGALTTWWIGAVGTAALWLHLNGATLATGGLSGLVIGMLTMMWAARGLAQRRVLDLLAGWQALAVLPGNRHRRASIGLTLSLLFAGILLTVALVGKLPAQGAFFGVGTLLLLAGLCGGSLQLGRWLKSPLTAPTPGRLAMRSAAANRGRSLLVVGLLAGAAFIIVAVAANARNFAHTDVFRKDSGTGGFSLRAVSTVPLPVDISTPAGRTRLGFSSEDEALLAGTRIYPLLYSGGDDISCLNLAVAQQPRVLGVSPAFLQQGGFTVLTKEKAASPWSRLTGGTPLPIFADADSAMWSLHANLGSPFSIANEKGTIAGLLPGSIFAGELLVSEAHFRRLFPAITRPRYFLIETPRGKERAVAEALRRNLGDFGLEVRTTRELLNAYIGVQNTYLSTFLALGGLGLLLGTLGLVVVLLRNALERRKEFALLLATGLTRRDLALLLILENAGLLVAGLLCGTITALIAVAPHLVSVEAQVNWGALAAVLLGILIIGLLSCLLAAHAATQGHLLEALREEGAN